MKLFNTRKKKVIAATTTGLLLVGVAVAALLVRAPLSGGGSVAATPRLEFVGTPTVLATSGTPLACSAAHDGTTLTLTLDNAFPGAFCDIRVMVTQQDGTTPLRFQDIKWATPVHEGYLNGTCGGAVSLNPSATPVEFRLSVPAGTPAGAFAATADAGLVAIDAASYVDGSCPRGAPTS